MSLITQAAPKAAAVRPALNAGCFQFLFAPWPRESAKHLIQARHDCLSLARNRLRDFIECGVPERARPTEVPRILGAQTTAFYSYCYYVITERS